MRILAVETSCDETGASVIEAEGVTLRLLSNVVATSLPLHSKTGGVIPEAAAREQLKYIIPVIKQALEESKSSQNNIDKLAVTVGPGLIGSLLVGVETVKAYAYAWKKPIIPVNHLFGHIYANFIEKRDIEFPAIALVVSGGHTDLVLMKGSKSLKWLGGTRDDAAGEALDKTGRLLGLPYPAGPKIEELAKKGKDIFKFPRPLMHSADYDFSFSGLKTAVFREVQKMDSAGRAPNLENISASVQTAIVDVLVTKTLKATKEFGAKSILLGGGVAANQTLRDKFELEIRSLKLKIPLLVPEKQLCTDNAAMIGAAATLIGKETSWDKIQANPELYFD
ncbi:MAG: tRNA (adenosine(37)-N6)-threonylcarbamoyltransferase complex transferase subunit TsaD [Candidatus Levybacteria bacterium RIFCSPHIGHO2_01_FULL_37_17]|nr:MAG: tRNA (adenosine(37)-N6)-threonylcarbamoyltransferase complex transferase subunit TsaD [Candidatus Levybacteria bacterium RIFCSPHIGHO2_01_FULL_37_17]OGH37109.1 MAG: tRNA (adenosine(37)-N6)-threonylcarbamoyltransferase complex transferase subunit TsaD [Candidatus Levybacteria bacterium RIFCSPLOWO2_01_FULL_38_23]